ncbi:MAG TPA: alpha/beta fold hydrolase [Polyangiaceae bacterium]|nr:alpha/beta fold hydrolase [Polyangiaceae bacterium]
MSARSTPCRARSTLISVLLVACGASLSCTTEPDRAARLSGVATRHAPIAPPAIAPPSGAIVARPNDQPDPARAFDPPAVLRLPDGLQTGERVPLLLVLHGFGVSSSLLIAKAGLNQVADQKKFAYLAPEGARDSLGRPFWNAGKSCCDLDHRRIDDVKRLRELLDANLTNASIDPKRVFVVGYSNGGFMAQRLACDVGDRIAAVVSVAGAAPTPDVPCTQHGALAVLEIHGDADPIVHYTGGTVFDRTDVAAHPSAPDTAHYWAQLLSCSSAPRTLPNIDLEPYVPDSETSVQRFDDCRGAVELWTVKGGQHYVALQPPALDAIWSFLQAHPKGGA